MCANDPKIWRWRQTIRAHISPSHMCMLRWLSALESTTMYTMCIEYTLSSSYQLFWCVFCCFCCCLVFARCLRFVSLSLSLWLGLYLSMVADEGKPQVKLPIPFSTFNFVSSSKPNSDRNNIPSKPNEAADDNCCRVCVLFLVSKCTHIYGRQAMSVLSVCIAFVSMRSGCVKHTSGFCVE